MLNSLKRLDISNNSIGNLPPELGMLSSLQNINSFGNPLKVPNFGTEKLLKWLRNKIPIQDQKEESKIYIRDVLNVNLSNSGIKSITLEMLQSNPKSFKVSGNLISALDMIFDFGTNLVTLELSKNCIKEFPQKSLPVLTVYMMEITIVFGPVL